jgi:hypothetical protein
MITLKSKTNFEDLILFTHETKLGSKYMVPKNITTTLGIIRASLFIVGVAATVAIAAIQIIIE